MFTPLWSRYVIAMNRSCIYMATVQIINAIRYKMKPPAEVILNGKMRNKFCFCIRKRMDLH